MLDLAKIKGCIFDLDGTIADSMQVWDAINEEFFKAHNITITKNFIAEISHMTLAQTAKYLVEKFELDMTDSQLMAMWQRRIASAYLEIPIKPDVLEVVKFFHARGCKMCIASATEVNLINIFLKAQNLTEMFHFVVSVSQVKRPKGFPDVYQKCSELMGLQASECVVFEDLLLAIEGAKMDSYQVVGVYDGTSDKSFEKIKLLCDDYLKQGEKSKLIFKD